MLGAQRSSFATFFDRAFAPRGIFITWADRYHYVRLTAGAQKTAAAGMVLVVAWAMFATTSNVLDKRTLASKQAEIADRKAAYTELARTLEQAHDLRTRLEARLEGLRTELTVARTDRLALRSERSSLQARLGMMERTLAELRDSEQSVIERLSEQASEGVGMVEQVIEMTGLDPNMLIAGATGVESERIDLTEREFLPAGLGQGGPFLPADGMLTDFPPGAELATMISLIEQQLDRWSTLREVVRSLPLTAPLDQFRISSAYGQRRDPMTNQRARHLGVDFVAPFGSPIYATAPGVVVFAGRHGRYGQLVEIDHGFGIRTRYAHLRKILVWEGQEVAHRQEVGLLGSSGRSTGPHVHYEIRFKGRPQNPMKYILAGKHLFKG